MGEPFRPKDYPFKIDLKQQCLNQIDFLQQVNGVRQLKDKEFLKFALYRYEKFWLPLAHDSKDECLSAPMDIEWIWHCHMLSPRKYSRDCQTLVGELINHTIRGRKEFKSSLQKSKERWSQKYPNIPFEVNLDNPSYPKEFVNFQSSLTYDVVSSAMRQNVFFYQVSLPHYSDTKYLELCLVRYQKFIYMKQQLPDEFIVPCYDIDVMWHSHQLNPRIYEKDMMRFIGNLFDHNDSVNDRSEGSQLNNSQATTKHFWKQYFSENFSQYGAMYRGQPPDGILYQMSFIDAYTVSTRNTLVTLQTYQLHLKDIQRGKIGLKVERSAYRKTVKPLVSLKAPYRPTLTFNKPIRFGFGTNVANKLKFSVYASYAPTICPCCTSKTAIGENYIDICQRIEETTEAGSMNTNLKIGREDVLQVTGDFTRPTRGELLLFLDRGKCETVHIPETIQQLWGPVALERLPPGVDNTCSVSTDRLKNHRGRV